MYNYFLTQNKLLKQSFQFMLVNLKRADKIRLFENAGIVRK